MSTQETGTSSHSARRQHYRGPAVLAVGFRPFFFCAALWSALAVAIWLLSLADLVELPCRFPAIAWHSHEMIYGYGAAVAAGFLLTAIPNWTGQLPIRGLPLLILVLLWLLGRITMSVSGVFDPIAAGLADLSFLALFLILTLREILAGRNWRNLPVIGVLAFLLLGNLIMHLEGGGLDIPEGLGGRIGVAGLAFLISVVGGRIVPSFTRNWLKKRGAARLPAPFGPIDKLALIATALTLLMWCAGLEGRLLGLIGLAAAVVSFARLARWQGLATFAEPLVWVLHLGYLWLPVGLAALAASQWDGLVTVSAAVHALTAGAIGTMTLAVMTRASLGHSGRPLHAGGLTLAIYLSVTVASVTRVAASIIQPIYQDLLLVSALAWIAAFGLFAIGYAPLLLSGARKFN